MSNGSTSYACSRTSDRDKWMKLAQVHPTMCIYMTQLDWPDAPIPSQSSCSGTVHFKLNSMCALIFDYNHPRANIATHWAIPRRLCGDVCVRACVWCDRISCVQCQWLSGLFYTFNFVQFVDKNCTQIVADGQRRSGGQIYLVQEIQCRSSLLTRVYLNRDQDIFAFNTCTQNRLKWLNNGDHACGANTHTYAASLFILFSILLHSRWPFWHFTPLVRLTRCDLLSGRASIRYRSFVSMISKTHTHTHMPWRTFSNTHNSPKNLSHFSRSRCF